MSNGLFSVYGIDLPKLVGDVVGPAVLPATLRVLVDGTPDADPTNAIAQTSTDYPCRGFVSEWSHQNRPNSNATQVAAKVVLLGGTLPAGVEPRARHQVVIDGLTYDVQGVTDDPAKATFELTVTTAHP
jgi:hypothetical protein